MRNVKSIIIVYDDDDGEIEVTIDQARLIYADLKELFGYGGYEGNGLIDTPPHTRIIKETYQPIIGDIRCEGK